MSKYIQLFPTLRCNSNCDFCFNRGMSRVQDLPRNRIPHLLQWLLQSGVKEVDILGGEPTLYPHIGELVSTLLMNDIKVWLSTNGTKPDRALELLKAGASVGLSVNSRRQLKRLEAFIARYRPHLKTLYSPHSYELVEEALRLRPSRVFLIYPDVVDRESMRYTVPFYIFYRDFQERFSPLGVTPVYCEGFIPEKGVSYRCPAGSRKLTVFGDGSVYPCYLLCRWKEYRLGNIFDTRAVDLWRHPVLKSFQSFESNTCSTKGCGLYSLCRGGCPAQSLYMLGRMDSSDPRCSTAR